MENPYIGMEKPIPDVKRYLERIHCENLAAADLPALNRLIDSHTKYVPFEDLDVCLGKQHPSLNTEDLYDKVVLRNRGGYCFELNGLFEKLLEGVGFDAFCVGVRIMYGKTFLPPKLHRGILVRLEGTLWYADVGYGGPAPITAIQLDAAAGWQQSGSRRYRGERTDREGKIWLQTDEGETLLFVFPTEPTPPVDFIGPNLICSTPGFGIFTRQLMVSRRTENGHVSVSGDTFTLKTPEGDTVRTLAEGELSGVLKTWFGMEYPG